MGADVKYVDKGRAAIVAALKVLHGLEVRVGVQGQTAYRAVQQQVVKRENGATSGPKREGTSRRKGQRKRGGKRSKKKMKWPTREARRVILKTRHQVRTVDIATFHEFGAPKVRLPERSFLRSTFRTSLPFLKKLQARSVKSIMHGANPVTLALQVGLRLENAVRKTIVTMKSPVLAESTRRRRYLITGDKWPQMLVDTGQLKNSISSVVVKDGRRIGGIGV